MVVFQQALLMVLEVLFFYAMTWMTDACCQFKSWNIPDIPVRRSFLISTGSCQTHYGAARSSGAVATGVAVATNALTVNHGSITICRNCGLAMTSVVRITTTRFLKFSTTKASHCDIRLWFFAHLRAEYRRRIRVERKNKARIDLTIASGFANTQLRIKAVTAKTFVRQTCKIRFFFRGSLMMDSLSSDQSVCHTNSGGASDSS